MPHARILMIMVLIAFAMTACSNNPSPTPHVPVYIHTVSSHPTIFPNDVPVTSKSQIVYWRPNYQL